jgi:hypothetical protein
MPDIEVQPELRQRVEQLPELRGVVVVAGQVLDHQPDP